MRVNLIAVIYFLLITVKIARNVLVTDDNFSRCNGHYLKLKTKAFEVHISHIAKGHLTQKPLKHKQINGLRNSC